MRNLLLAVLLLAPLAASADKSECEIVAELAKAAAEARDHGTPLAMMLDASKDEEVGNLVRSVIRMAYSSHLPPDKLEELYLSQCPKLSPEQPAQPSWRT